MALTAQQIIPLLDDCLQTEYTFYDTGKPARLLEGLDGDDQAFVLDWARRIASTNLEIAYRFIGMAPQVLARMDYPLIEGWVLQAMGEYDRAGLRPALAALEDIELFVSQGENRAAGCLLEERMGVLSHFVQGLSGRRLKLAQARETYTDTETLFLPGVIAHLGKRRQNFSLYKAQVTHLWAQARFGTFHPPLAALMADYPDPERALAVFHALEVARLDGRIARELPGLHREMQSLRRAFGESPPPPEWRRLTAPLTSSAATVWDSVALLAEALALSSALPLPAPACYQGILDPQAVAAALERRIPREKALFRYTLKALAEEADRKPAGRREKPEFKARIQPDDALPEGLYVEITLDDKPVAPPETVTKLITSIIQDFGGIPDDYLTPAGPGEYDPRDFGEAERDPDEVWGGTYHEEGAFLYPEWDYRRRHYRKNWCVVRERSVPPVHDGFVPRTLEKYSRLLIGIRKGFEALRDTDRRLKRQSFGDSVDIDAFVAAWSDARRGVEMTDRLFTRPHKEERDIAVMFMVDMSGSTQGWVNDAQRESLVLLAEALELLGDRYAIYGFTGMTRKRCDLFHIKEFDEGYDGAVKARISGIAPGDYTRMGPAIRHLTEKLVAVEARAKLLITLSDGRPEDYHRDYRGAYGIEDTRQALLEAHRHGIHPFCITIDEEGADYLPRMYGVAHYTVIDDVAKLPEKVAGIYRRLTKR
uniref:Nitric oxide reductase NorD protein n=1 Tax=Candidatus Kentrum eta TaxID=2126337 RepID=A0A450U9V1_9GAMM|nr:MAG: nitric oxide reductase NorD protein [Candidatus Kentron sp. H]VFJ90438.1 MAG: nitric oxide reductase NorD protein [Candidatus Kentron sp. H]VFJ97078.1 MAG: nitric oxide reductase NorD protein [Candidatus Kentron sp. H]